MRNLLTINFSGISTNPNFGKIMQIRLKSFIHKLINYAICRVHSFKTNVHVCIFGNLDFWWKHYLIIYSIITFNFVWKSDILMVEYVLKSLPKIMESRKKCISCWKLPIFILTFNSFKNNVIQIFPKINILRNK